MKSHRYPFTYKLKDNVYVHLEHTNDLLTCVRFFDDNKEEINIPDEFKLYEDVSVVVDAEKKLINPFRDTQTYAIPKDGYYTLKYNDLPIIQLQTRSYCSYPPKIVNMIIACDCGEHDYPAGKPTVSPATPSLCSGTVGSF